MQIIVDLITACQAEADTESAQCDPSLELIRLRGDFVLPLGIEWFRTLPLLISQASPDSECFQQVFGKQAQSCVAFVKSGDNVCLLQVLEITSCCLTTIYSHPILLGSEANICVYSDSVFPHQE